MRRDTDGVIILQALSCDSCAVLPETLFGLPVTALADHALAPKRGSTEGEEVRVLGGPETGEWDNRGIRELTLPRSLRRIGDYAFLNLRAMEKLRLADGVESTGSASFMNCRSFSRLELTRLSGRQGPALSAILQALPQELELTLHYPDGSRQCLLFPEYRESYTENSAAHHFDLHIAGGGYAYHSVFRSRTLRMADYDALWRAYLAAEHEEESALRLAWLRLRWPRELGSRFRADYAAYLAEHMEEALLLALEEKDAEGLRMLLSLAEPTDVALSAALGRARETGSTEATALLLEARHRRGGAGRAKRFEL